jgi:ABC-type multidrug transport system fused ATPase/permease subunit
MQQSRRCATVRNATHVVVLKHGEVVEAGTSLVPIVARAPCD